MPTGVCDTCGDRFRCDKSAVGTESACHCGGTIFVGQAMKTSDLIGGILGIVLGAIGVALLGLGIWGDSRLQTILGLAVLVAGMAVCGKALWNANSAGVEGERLQSLKMKRDSLALACLGLLGLVICFFPWVYAGEAADPGNARSTLLGGTIEEALAGNPNLGMKTSYIGLQLGIGFVFAGLCLATFGVALIGLLRDRFRVGLLLVFVLSAVTCCVVTMFLAMQESMLSGLPKFVEFSADGTITALGASPELAWGTYAAGVPALCLLNVSMVLAAMNRLPGDTAESVVIIDESDVPIATADPKVAVAEAVVTATKPAIAVAEPVIPAEELEAPVAAPVAAIAPVAQATPAPAQATRDIAYRCEHCAASVNLPESTAGTSVSCPNCQNPIDVPPMAIAVGQPPQS